MNRIQIQTRIIYEGNYPYIKQNIEIRTVPFSQKIVKYIFLRYFKIWGILGRKSKLAALSSSVISKRNGFRNLFYRKTPIYHNSTNIRIVFLECNLNFFFSHNNTNYFDTLKMIFLSIKELNWQIYIFKYRQIEQHFSFPYT